MASRLSAWAKKTKLVAVTRKRVVKLLKCGETGQQCKKHTPIAFSGKYSQICASRVKQENMNNNNNMSNYNNFKKGE